MGGGERGPRTVAASLGAVNELPSLRLNSHTFVIASLYPLTGTHFAVETGKGLVSSHFQYFINIKT